MLFQVAVRSPPAAIGGEGYWELSTSLQTEHLYGLAHRTSDFLGILPQFDQVRRP